MADQENKEGEQPVGETPAAPAFSPQRLYLKDLSFETPKGTDIFLKQWEPKVNQDLSTTSSKLSEDIFEVCMRITITVSHQEETLYLVEVEQAGIFKITGLSDQQLAQVLNTTCPNIIYPYAREVVDSTLTKASFPPLMLPPVNFEALFAHALAEAKAKEEGQSDVGEQIKH